MDRDTYDTIAIEENGEMNKEFTELIELAVGPNRTKLQFAQETGISQVHLTRLTKNAGKPTLDTLRKIAAHSEGRVTVTMLKRSLNMEITKDDEREDIDTLPVERRNAIKLDDIKNGIYELCLKKPNKYESLEDLIIGSFDMLFGYKGMDYEFSEGIKLPIKDSKRHGGAELYSHVSIWWSDGNITCDTSFIIFFCETKNGGLIVTDVAFDLDTLIRYENDLAKQIEEGMIPAADVSEENGIICVTTNKTASEKFNDILSRIQTERDAFILKNIEEFSGELTKYAGSKEEEEAFNRIIKRFVKAKEEE